MSTSAISREAASTTMSAKDLMDISFPDVEYYWGDLLRRRGRLGLIGAPKTAKSFFVLQLGLSIATGTPFLGMETPKAAVLYINFEISPEMLQERLQHLCKEISIEPPDNLHIATLVGCPLDKPSGSKQVEGLVEGLKSDGGELDVLIIDPRRQGMGGDENQSEVVNAWCRNVDEIRTR